MTAPVAAPTMINSTMLTVAENAIPKSRPSGRPTRIKTTQASILDLNIISLTAHRLDSVQPWVSRELSAAESEDTEKSGLGHALVLLGFQGRLDPAQFQQVIHEVGMFQRQLQDMVLQLLEPRSYIEGHE